MLNFIKFSESLRNFLSRWLMSPLQGLSFSSWCQALVGNHFRISPRYWPRAFLTTLASLKNSFDARKKEKKYGPTIQQVQVIRPIFILGHYRSGTTHLQNLFSVDPNMAYPNYLQATHPRTFITTEAKIQNWAKNLTPTSRPYDNVKLGLATPAEDELALCNDTLLSPHMSWHFPRRAEHYDKYFSFEQATAQERDQWKHSLKGFAQKLTHKYGANQLVFKSPCHTARISLILETFPDALFIHIHRNPYRVFVSTKNMEINARPLFAYQKYDFKNLHEFILERYKKIYQAYFKDKDKIPQEQFCELSFDQLEKEPLKTMEFVYQSLSLEHFATAKPLIESYLSSLKSYQKNRYQELPAAIKERINQKWEFCFRAWNYSLDPFSHREKVVKADEG